MARKFFVEPFAGSKVIELREWLNNQLLPALGSFLNGLVDKVGVLEARLSDVAEMRKIIAELERQLRETERKIDQPLSPTQLEDVRANLGIPVNLADRLEALETARTVTEPDKAKLSEELEQEILALGRGAPVEDVADLIEEASLPNADGLALLEKADVPVGPHKRKHVAELLGEAQPPTTLNRAVDWLRTH